MIVSKSFRWSKAGPALMLGMVLFGATADRAHAAGNPLDTLQLHGFLSQALVITDENNFFGPSSDDGSFKFTEVGANASLRPHQDVLIAAQVLSRRAGGDGSDARPVLDYGVIDYQMLSDQQRTLGAQLGRFKNPFGFYNQTRDVAFTRPSILLPQSIYFDRTRSLGLAADGLTGYLEERLPSGTMRFQAGIGRPQAGDDVEQQLFADSKGETSSIAQLRYDHQGGQFIAALSAADVHLDLTTDTRNGEFTFRPWILSAQYNEEAWSLTAEFALRQLELEGMGRARNFDITGESWYVQYTRRFHQDWQWLIRYDSLIANRDDRNGKAFAATGAGPAHSQFARDITLGLQWNVSPQVMLATEYHHVDGTGWLPVEDNPDPSATERYWEMLLLQLSLRF